MGARQNQPPPESVTDTVGLEDETLNTSKAATTIPLGIGQMKTVIRWVTPIYGQRVVKAATSAGKSK
jgi:hypothetical protein